MFTLRWKHTRKDKIMIVRFPTWGSAMLQVMMIRQVFPQHVFYLNDDEV